MWHSCGKEWSLILCRTKTFGSMNTNIGTVDYVGDPNNCAKVRRNRLTGERPHTYTWNITSLWLFTCWGFVSRMDARSEPFQIQRKIVGTKPGSWMCWISWLKCINSPTAPVSICSSLFRLFILFIVIVYTEHSSWLNRWNGAVGPQRKPILEFTVGCYGPSYMITKIHYLTFHYLASTAPMAWYRWGAVKKPNKQSTAHNENPQPAMTSITVNDAIKL
jgi:hypothetical protein